MLKVEEARARILAAVQPLSAETVVLVEAAGRALAEPLTSRRSLPPFDNSAMDGYALRAEDSEGASDDAPVRLEVRGLALAGGEPVPPVTKGAAARVMTGAPIPAGADAVLMRERADESGVTDAAGTVGIKREVRPGENIRRKGEDVAESDLVGAPGDVVTPARLNLLAQAGHLSVVVHRRPRVAILASGDELKELGAPVGAGDIVNSNAHAIAAAVRAAGAVPELLGIARDTLEDHVRRVDAARGADVLLTIGGVSVGTHDFVRPAFDEVGVALELWKVAMRPGKPLAFGRRDQQLVFGLPGNPVSSQVTFELFVRPALLRLMGRTKVLRQRVKATVVEGSFKKAPGFAVFARARCTVVDGLFQLTFDAKQGSGQVSGLARANCLCALPEESEGAAPGDVVDVQLLDDDALLGE